MPLAVDRPTPPREPPKSRLEEISTRWAQVGDPLQFVMRYGTAIESYLTALTGKREDAAEIRQEFLASMMQHRFGSANPDQGRFRQYLKTAVRNAARMHFRRLQSRKAVSADESQLAEIPAREPAAEVEWLAEWRRCVLDRTWAALHRRQQETPDSLAYSVMKLHSEFGQSAESDELAQRLSQQLGRTIRAEAYRKQLSRARRLFAELLVHEVAKTLETPNADEVEAELTETGLMSSIRQFLPDDWRIAWLSET